MSDTTPTSRYSGGDGSSIEKAVVVHAPDRPSGIWAEYAWLEARFGERDVDWSCERQTLVFADDIPFDVIDVLVYAENPFDAVSVHFDTSPWFWTR